MFSVVPSAADVEGVKVTLLVQLESAANLDPQAFTCVNSMAFTPH